MESQTLENNLNRLKEIGLDKKNKVEKEKIQELFGKDRVNKINFKEMLINTISRYLLNNKSKIITASSVEYTKKGDIETIENVYFIKR